MKNGECAQTLPTSTSVVPRMTFLLTRIDKIVDSIASYDIMALLDCFQDITRYGSVEKMKKRPVS
jgi:hypothetical protein